MCGRDPYRNGFSEDGFSCSNDPAGPPSGIVGWVIFWCSIIALSVIGAFFSA